MDGYALIRCTAPLHSATPHLVSSFHFTAQDRTDGGWKFEKSVKDAFVRVKCRNRSQTSVPPGSDCGLHKYRASGREEAKRGSRTR